MDEIGVPAEIDAGAPVVEPPSPSIPALGGSSGCCLLRAEHAAQDRGPGAVFFAYLEDVDLALRLDCAGYETTSSQRRSRSMRAPRRRERSRRSRFTSSRETGGCCFRLHGPRSLGATAWRALVDVAHGAYSSFTTPLAPWAGRLEALRFRRYVRFLRRSRAARRLCRRLSEPTASDAARDAEAQAPVLRSETREGRSRRTAQANYAAPMLTSDAAETNGN